MSPFTSTSMMSRRVSGDCGRSSRGAIGNDGAGWADLTRPWGAGATQQAHSHSLGQLTLPRLATLAGPN
jgi:hypothetical protein